MTTLRDNWPALAERGIAIDDARARAAAERIHSNDSIHRHGELDANVCGHCALAGLYAVQALDGLDAQAELLEVLNAARAIEVHDLSESGLGVAVVGWHELREAIAHYDDAAKGPATRGDELDKLRADVRFLLDLIEGEDTDLSDCPYFRRGQPGADPDGTCSYGCYDEPACQTSQPSGGWPLARIRSEHPRPDDEDGEA